MEKQTERFLFSRKSAASALEISLRKVDDLLARGLLRGVKIGRSTRIPVAELARLAKTGCAKGAERE